MLLEVDIAFFWTALLVLFGLTYTLNQVLDRLIERARNKARQENNLKIPNPSISAHS